MKRLLPLWVLFLACCAMHCGEPPVHSPFAIPADDMISALRAANEDSIELGAGSELITLTNLDHCRVLFPIDIYFEMSPQHPEERQFDRPPMCDLEWEPYDSAMGSGVADAFYGGAEFFKHQSRRSFLHEIVAYTPREKVKVLRFISDSLVFIKDTLVDSHIREFLVMKVFYHDREFERAFPGRKTSAPFNYDTLMSMYHEAFNELGQLAPTLGMQLLRRKKFTDGDEFYQFKRLPFKEAFEICTWANWQTNELMQLALMPARPWEEYVLSIDAKGRDEHLNLRYDPRTERYDTIIPTWEVLISDTFQELQHVYNIQRTDLAIWFMYTGPRDSW